MPPRWHHLLAVAAMAVVLLLVSANLEENQDLESRFQPKEVLQALSDAHHSMLADLEEYQKSTRDTRAGFSKETKTGRTSRCECFHDRVAAVVFDQAHPMDGDDSGVDDWAVGVQTL